MVLKVLCSKTCFVFHTLFECGVTNESVLCLFWMCFIEIGRFFKCLCITMIIIFEYLKYERKFSILQTFWYQINFVFKLIIWKLCDLEYIKSVSVFVLEKWLPHSVPGSKASKTTFSITEFSHRDRSVIALVSACGRRLLTFVN